MKSMYNTKIYSFLVLGTSLFLFLFTYITDTKAATCSITLANWSKTSSTVGSAVDLIVGGNNCMGKEVTFNIWQRNKDGLSDNITTFKATFDTLGVSAGSTALAHWTIDGSKTGKVSKPPNDTNYEFYFVAKCSSENCGTRTSGSLFVPISSSTCILTPQSPRWVSQVTSTGPIIAYVGSPIALKVDGQGCDGYSVSFDIYNDHNNNYVTTVNGKFANGVVVSNYTFTSSDYSKAGNSPLVEQVYFKVSVFDGSGNKLSQAIGQARSTQIDLYPTKDPNESGTGGGGACNNNGTCDAGETSVTCSRDCPVGPGAGQTFPFKIENPLQASSLIELIDVITTWLFNLAIPVAVVMIVWAGVMFLISRGDTAKVTKARQILLYAVVGLAIILIGKGFITLIESVLNLGAGP